MALKASRSTDSSRIAKRLIPKIAKNYMDNTDAKETIIQGYSTTRTRETSGPAACDEHLNKRYLQSQTACAKEIGAIENYLTKPTLKSHIVIASLIAQNISYFTQSNLGPRTSSHQESYPNHKGNRRTTGRSLRCHVQDMCEKIIEGMYGPFRIISFSLAAYNSDPRNYPYSSDFLEVFEDLLGRERGGGP